MELSKLVKKQIASPSPIRQIMKMADRKNIISMGLDPDDVISFGGGWVNHGAPEEMRQLYSEIALDPDAFHITGGYSSTPGTMELRGILSDLEHKFFGVRSNDTNVIVGQSSTQLTHDLFVTLLDPTDTIMLMDPTYANYPGQLEFAAPGVKREYLQVLDTESWSYVPDVGETVDRFEELFDRTKPKVVLFPAPDNPTSQNLPEGLVGAIVDRAEDAGSFVIVDCAYKTQFFTDLPSYLGLSPLDHEGVIHINSNSKWGRGLGRRLGWIVASDHVIDGMERVQQCTILCPDSLHQMVLTRFFSKVMADGSLERYLTETTELYRTAADATLKAIDEHLGMPRLVPQGGLYTCMDVAQDADELVPRLLKNSGVLFIPGGGFGASLKNAVRISYGPMCYDLEKIDAGMARVGRYLETGEKQV